MFILIFYVQAVIAEAYIVFVIHNKYRHLIKNLYLILGE